MVINLKKFLISSGMAILFLFMPSILLANDAHEIIIKQMKTLGYDAQDIGVCEGISMAAVEAILLGDEAKSEFNARISFIKKHEKDLVELITKAQEAVKKEKPSESQSSTTNLLGEYRRALEVRAFFDKVELYQNPNKHDDLLGEHLTQSYGEEISLFAQSKTMEEDGWLQRVFCTSSIYYTKKDLIPFLDGIVEVIKKYNLTKIALQFSKKTHTIIAVYDLNKGSWSIIDPADLDNPKYVCIDSSDRAEDIIMHCLFPDVIDKFKAITSINIFTTFTYSRKHNLEKLFSELKNKLENSITVEKSKVTNNEEISLLIMATINNDPELVAKLISVGANVDQEDKDGTTPLSAAINRNRPEMVAQIIAAHANVDHIYKDGNTPLFEAININNPQLVGQLIQAKADVNQSSPDGMTPLLLASELGNTKIVSLLVEAGANVDQAKNGITPLSVAVYKNNPGLVVQLMKAKADVNQSSPDGTTPLLLASELGNTKIVSLLKT